MAADAPPSKRVNESPSVPFACIVLVSKYSQREQVLFSSPSSYSVASFEILHAPNICVQGVTVSVVSELVSGVCVFKLLFSFFVTQETVEISIAKQSNTNIAFFIKL